MIKDRARALYRYCLYMGSKWIATHYSISTLITNVAMFGLGWLACYLALQQLSPTALALLAGAMVGAAVAPIGWVVAAILLHDIDRERHTNRLAALDETIAKYQELDALYREHMLRQWRVGDDEREHPE